MPRRVTSCVISTIRGCQGAILAQPRRWPELKQAIGIARIPTWPIHLSGLPISSSKDSAAKIVLAAGCIWACLSLSEAGAADRDQNSNEAFCLRHIKEQVILQDCRWNKVKPPTATCDDATRNDALTIENNKLSLYEKMAFGETGCSGSAPEDRRMPDRPRGENEGEPARPSTTDEPSS